MSDECVFCQMISGTLPARVVLDDQDCLAFLDVRPVFPGHALVVPKVHFETLTDLEPALVRPLFASARRLATAVEAGFGAHGSFVAVNNRISQSVAHLHVHVIPRHKKDGLRGFFWPRQRYASEEEMEAVAASLRSAVDAVPAE